MTRDKTFSGNVVDSKNSPYKPLKVVPKDTPLVPWKPGPRKDGLEPAKIVPKDSPLTAYKRDSTKGSPLVPASQLSEKLPFVPLNKLKNVKENVYITRRRLVWKQIMPSSLPIFKRKPNIKLLYSIDHDGNLQLCTIKSKNRLSLRYGDSEIEKESSIIYKVYIANPDKVERTLSKIHKYAHDMKSSRIASTISNKISTLNDNEYPDLDLPSQIVRKYPPWYYGFVGNSYISFDIDDSISPPNGMDWQFGHIHFGNAQMGQTSAYFCYNYKNIKDEFKFDFSWLYNNSSHPNSSNWATALAHAMMNMDISRWFSIYFHWFNTNGNPDETSAPALCDCITSGVFRSRDTEVFDHMKITMDSGNQIRAKGIRVVLNDQEICKEEFTTPIVIGGSAGLPEYKLDDHIEKRRMEHIGLAVRPEIDVPITFLASQIGQCLSLRRPGQWELFYPDGPVPFYGARPVSWCGDTAIWAIQKTTYWMHEAIYFDLFEDWGSSDPWRYFKNRNMCYHYSNTLYKYLRHLPKGFYAKINQSGHGTFFAQWEDDIFNERSFQNTFEGLGGNQSCRIRVKKFTCGMAYIHPTSGEVEIPNISWEAENQPSSLDGFANCNKTIYSDP